MSWVLVLHENELLQSNVADLLAEVLPFDIQVASNLADATELFDLYGRIHCKLVVSSFSPPVDGNASQALDRTQVTAIALLKEIRARREQPPWLFLASFDDGSRSEELAGLANVRVLNVLKFGLSLRTEALNLVGGGGVVPRRVDVEISLVDGVYGWSLRGFNGTAIENSGVIDIDPVALGELTKASSGAALADRAGLGQIGLDLYMQFLANNLRSGLELAMSSAVGASVENARFRFCVDEHTNQLLFETLGKPCTRGAPLEHWMLQAPMFRKYRGSGDRFPLFKDRVSQSRPVSCLIIQGESAGFEPLYEMAGGEYVAAKYGAIGQAAVEATMLYRYLTSNYEHFGIEQPELLQPGLNENYGDVVRNKLASRRWQLIHYVGHSSMSDSGTAFLALGRGSRDALEIAELARLASAAQFVYLSSCQSSNARFVRELVSRSIPAVLGYAWPVQDDVAIRFANSFYQHLFEGGQEKRFLEYAFMRSKRDMHRALPDNTAWAAPLLFMQMLGGESARNH